MIWQRNILGRYNFRGYTQPIGTLHQLKWSQGGPRCQKLCTNHQSLELFFFLLTKKKNVDPSIKSNWVKPPDFPQQLFSSWTAKTSTTKNLTHFLSCWPPSRTPEIYGPWISAQRVDRKTPATLPDVTGLSASFQTLVQSGTVTVETIDQISKAHNVISGKWMIFEEPDKIDMLWEKVVYCLCVERQKGCAKVSTWKGSGERHVICVYVDDYTDLEEVDGLRKALRAIGVDRRIGFKPDAFSLS